MTTLVNPDDATLARIAGTRARRLLAVFAHPDDEAYGSAGALARAGADPGAAVALLCLTRGEASSVMAREGLTRNEIAARREARLVRVGEIVRLDALLLPGLPDGRLAREPLERVAAPVLRAVRCFRPHVVLAHDPRGVNGHADHVATHWAVRRAIEQAAPAPRLAMVAYPPETAEALRPRLLFPTPEAEIDVVLDLSPTEAEAKEACLRVHDAMVTLVEGDPGGRVFRPPVERYDLLGEAFAPPLGDLFEALARA